MRKFLKALLAAGCAVLLIWQFVDSMNHDVLSETTVNFDGKEVSRTAVKADRELENTDDLSSYNQEISDNELAAQIYADNSKLLVLVNKSNPWGNEDIELVSICKGRLKVSSEMYDDLRHMLKDASDCGYSYWIASAYRDWDKQQRLINEDVIKYQKAGMTYDAALAKTMEETAPAGYSEHETGLALDILCSENSKMDVSQENYAANIWLQQHCSEYGFILRYPRGKEDITGFSYEPWHFRYVGREAAGYITEKGITLEEFYELSARL